ncbi:hypothetical protein PF007_g32067 [Phytophthora fragariae]|uniref:RxLR effector protein n=1 Tax=Phytophthora fragariae TaxID=53985 RepID=A0A6A3PQL7_9STRA|nr:hypothetical protein PF007_g32067 [Phytophthora fragariae]
MRLSYVLLVSCVAALLAPSNVVAENPSVSTVASPEQVAGARNEGNDRRLLRSHEAPEEEERIITGNMLLDLVAQNDKAIFAKWKEDGVMTDTLRMHLNQPEHGLTPRQVNDIVNRYRPHVE